MNKKVVIGIVAAVIFIAMVGLIIFFMINQSKITPEEIWQKYI